MSQEQEQEQEDIQDKDKKDLVVMDFDEIVKERRCIKLGGVKYQLLEPMDFGLRKQAEIAKAYKRIQTLFENPNDGNERIAKEMLDKALRQIVPTIPSDVRAKLTEYGKLAILNVFMLALDKVIPAPAQDQDRDQDWEESHSNHVTPTEVGAGAEG